MYKENFMINKKKMNYPPKKKEVESLGKMVQIFKSHYIFSNNTPKVGSSFYFC